MKDAGIRVRIEKNLRDDFAAVCQSEGRRASDVLREFMQTYVDHNQLGQGSLFTASTQPPQTQTKGKK